MTKDYSQLPLRQSIIANILVFPCSLYLTGALALEWSLNSVDYIPVARYEL